MKLTKTEALEMFESGAELARSLGISRSAISQWPEELDDQRIAMVLGAAIQLGKKIPNRLIPWVKVSYDERKRLRPSPSAPQEGAGAEANDSGAFVAVS